MVKRIVILVVLLWSSWAFAQYEHELFTGDEFSIVWEQIPQNALGWEWKIVRSDGFLITQGETDVMLVTTSILSAGIYVFHCRAWNHYQVTPPDRTYSEWANTLSHGKVDDVIRAWQIKINLRPVGPLIFDYERYLP